MRADGNHCGTASFHGTVEGVNDTTAAVVIAAADVHAIIAAAAVVDVVVGGIVVGRVVSGDVTAVVEDGRTFGGPATVNGLGFGVRVRIGAGAGDGVVVGDNVVMVVDGVRVGVVVGGGGFGAAVVVGCDVSGVATVDDGGFVVVLGGAPQDFHDYGLSGGSERLHRLRVAGLG